MQPNDLSAIRRIVEGKKVDGCVLFQAMENDAVISYLKSKNIPFVLMGSCDDSDIIQVDNTQKEACQELTTILLLQEIGKIAILGGNMQNQVNKNRYEGFLNACHNFGYKLDGSRMFLNLDNDILIARAAADAMEMGAECLICMDDIICAEVLKYIEKAEKTIPEDVRVASFYDSRMLREYGVSVTAIHFDSEELGSVACRLLLDVLDNREVERKTELGYQVVLRESTKFNKG